LVLVTRGYKLAHQSVHTDICS